MQESLHWRLSVSLRDGPYAQTASIDFSRRETIDEQLGQLSFEQRGYNCSTLFEFRNEAGELLAFRATAYCSHSVDAVESITAQREVAGHETQARSS